MKEVYLAYDITDRSESVEVFKKVEDAEKYIRKKAEDHVINRNDLDIEEGRDYKGRLYITIIINNYNYIETDIYAEFYVVNKELL